MEEPKTNATAGARILVVDDDDDIREIVHVMLAREGFAVDEAANADEAMAQMAHHPDLVILDVMMPGRSGIELCREIRQGDTMPILFLSAKTRDVDKAEGLASGGDDYLIKPFSALELVSRVKALLRRCMVYQNAACPAAKTVRTGQLTVDCATGAATLAGIPLTLTETEAQLLKLLALHRGNVLSAREIYEAVWNETFLPSSNNTVMVHIKNLRKKLETDLTHPQYIHTVWGKGYYLA